MTERLQIYRFAIVGGLGFVVDAASLWILVSNSFNPYLARVCSFFIAVIVTWLLNSAWTFASPEKTKSRRHMLAYFSIQSVAAGLNFAIYSVILLWIGTSPQNSVFAMTVGSFFGMFINYVGTREILKPN